SSQRFSSVIVFSILFDFPRSMLAVWYGNSCVQLAPRLHLDRASGGDRDHRDFGKLTVAGALSREGQGAIHPVPWEPAANRFGIGGEVGLGFRCSWADYRSFQGRVNRLFSGLRAVRGGALGSIRWRRSRLRFGTMLFANGRRIGGPDFNRFHG